MLRRVDWLDDFLRALAEERLIRVSVGDRLRAARLLYLLAATGENLDEATQVAGWLAPIFCRSEQEQRHFHGRLVAWMKARSEAEASPASVGAAGEPTSGERAVGQAERRGWDAWLILLLTFTVFCLISFLIWHLGGLESGAAVDGNSPDGPKTDFFSVWSRISLALLPVLCLALWLWLRGRRQAVLSHNAAPEDAMSERQFFRGADRVLFRAGPFRRDVRALRRRVPVASSELAIERTVSSTCEAGGFVRLQYDTRLVLSEYVLLVDRRSSWDHLATIGDILEERLRAAHVPYHRYDFLSDPRRMFRVSAKAGANIKVSLGEMLGVHAGQTLLIVTDGDPLLDPITQTPSPWTHRLSAFSFVALLTPVAHEAWTDREEALAKARFRLFHATPEGFARLVTTLAAGGAPAKERGSVDRAMPFAGLFQRLDANRYRYMSTAPLPEEEGKRLLGWLKGALGHEAFDLLCAVAVFPMIRPSLSIFLGARLKDGLGVPLLNEGRMGSLARLVWLREGFMPYWLRKVLITRLPAERANDVHDALYAFLSKQEATPSGTPIDLAPRDRGKAWEWFRRTARADPSSPLNDRLFLTFARTRNPLSVLSPPLLTELMRPKLEVMDVAASASCLITAALLWWWNPASIVPPEYSKYMPVSIIICLAVFYLLERWLHPSALFAKVRHDNLAGLATILAAVVVMAGIGLVTPYLLDAFMPPNLLDAVIPAWVDIIRLPRLR